MREDLTGRTFARLTVLGLGERTEREVLWRCSCECGEIRNVRGAQLKSGKSKSCGCIQRKPTHESNLQRFRASYDLAESGCWEWKLWLDPEGYGRFKINARAHTAHRAAYLMFVGPIPPGLHIDHLCRNRKCVNPAHLEPVTTQENTARGLVTNRIRCKHGHEFTPENTYVNKTGQRYCRACKRRRLRARYDKTQRKETLLTPPPNKPELTPEGAAARFWSKVDKSGGPDACWIWTGARSGSGYGVFQFEGSARAAHRFAYELTHGPIERAPGYHGTLVCHTCDVRECVNPAHLWTGSVADNSVDMVAKGRSATGTRHGRHTVPESRCRGERNGMRRYPERHARGESAGTAKLTAAAVREIRQASASGESYASIARRLGLNPTTVARAARGKNWSHIT